MELLRYYGRVLRVAFTHSLDIAQAVIFASLIAIGFVSHFFPKLQVTMTTWASELTGSQVAAVILGTIFGIRLILAPYWMYKKNKELHEIPDILIETRRAAEILERIGGGFHVIVRDFHLTNRSGVPVSLEIRLRLNFGGLFMSPDQDETPLGFIEANRHVDPSIGQHLGRLVSLSSKQGIIGYLSYTILHYDQFNPFSIDDLQMSDKELQITEHVSRMRRSIPIQQGREYLFREIDQAF